MKHFQNIQPKAYGSAFCFFCVPTHNSTSSVKLCRFHLHGLDWLSLKRQTFGSKSNDEDEHLRFFKTLRGFCTEKLSHCLDTLVLWNIRLLGQSSSRSADFYCCGLWVQGHPIAEIDALRSLGFVLKTLVILLVVKMSRNIRLCKRYSKRMRIQASQGQALVVCERTWWMWNHILRNIYTRTVSKEHNTSPGRSATESSSSIDRNPKVIRTWNE